MEIFSAKPARPLKPLLYMQNQRCVSELGGAADGGEENRGKLTQPAMDIGPTWKFRFIVIAPNGNVDSIHYLPPGASGTPEANGTEIVSQSGVNLGNHTAIYYYWYPDGNGASTYLSTTTAGTYLDMAFKSTYNPATLTVPMDMELHYALGKGNTGLNVYMVANHPSSYSTYGNATIDFIQMIWPGPHTLTSLLCENQYLDHEHARIAGEFCEFRNNHRCNGRAIAGSIDDRHYPAAIDYELHWT